MKILCSDFDNTLYFKDDILKTTKNIESARNFIAQGNIFCIITGRTYMEIKPDLTRLNVPYTYLVCADGAMILDSTDYCLKKINLDKDIVEKAFNILKENGYDPYLEDGYNITTNTNDCIKVASLYATNKEDGIEIAKKIAKELNVYAYASRKHININNIKNDKKQALLRLAEVANLNPKEFYVIGDDINDYEMLDKFKAAIVEKHNPILDNMHLPIYKTLSDYIEYIMLR
ncbi:MAG: HAD-IIB family hydrolase [Bacilli bacterium]|nr:HAD-IIB family hydrolase [Bacilli bacterium]